VKRTVSACRPAIRSTSDEALIARLIATAVCRVTERRPVEGEKLAVDDDDSGC
jgi:hypothetical protein